MVTALLVYLILALLIAFIAIMAWHKRRHEPDHVVNIAKCSSCGAVTFQSIAADMAREPVLCTECA